MLPQPRALVEQLDQGGSGKDREIRGTERARIGREGRVPNSGRQTEVATRPEHSEDEFFGAGHLAAHAHRAAQDQVEAVLVRAVACRAFAVPQVVQAAQLCQPVEVRAGERLEVRARGERAADTAELRAPQHWSIVFPGTFCGIFRADCSHRRNRPGRRHSAGSTI